jgi:outer membrane protein assembly factor BamB
MIESSPLLVKNILYFASYDEHEQSIVYALNVRTHRARWRFAVPAKVTSSPALFSGRLYFGSYAGMLYALRARTGKLVFAVRPPGKTGNGSGFYGTPALAYGRVYIGGINGMVYAFGARSGALQWATSTGSDVYSSPAVWRGKVYAGSYKNHRFFAFNAATGRILWSFRADGNILGSPTILAGLVYFSTTSGLTYALDARTGAEVWRFPDGQYSPLAVAGGRVLLTGKGRIYGLDPIRPKPSSKKNARSN